MCVCVCRIVFDCVLVSLHLSFFRYHSPPSLSFAVWVCVCMIFFVFVYKQVKSCNRFISIWKWKQLLDTRVSSSSRDAKKERKTDNPYRIYWRSSHIQLDNSNLKMHFSCRPQHVTDRSCVYAAVDVCQMFQILSFSLSFTETPLRRCEIHSMCVYRTEHVQCTQSHTGWDTRNTLTFRK